MDVDLNYMKVEKKKPKEHPYDPFIHKFVIILLARLLTRHFRLEYIFANHPSCKNGPWKLADSETILDVALGDTERGQLVAAFEVETRSSLESGDAKNRWVAAAKASYLDIVAPDLWIPRISELAKEWDVALHDVWSYSLIRGDLRLGRVSQSKDGFLAEADEMEERLVI